MNDEKPFRRCFRIELPPTAKAGIHAQLDARLAALDARIHDKADTGRNGPDGRAVEIRTRQAEKDAGDVLDGLKGILSSERGVRILSHRCSHGLADGPCDVDLTWES